MVPARQVAPLTRAALDVLGYRYPTDPSDVEGLLTGLQLENEDEVEDDFNEGDDTGDHR
jgi:hypothetical protein